MGGNNKRDFIKKKYSGGGKNNNNNNSNYNKNNNGDKAISKRLEMKSSTLSRKQQAQEVIRSVWFVHFTKIKK